MAADAVEVGQVVHEERGRPKMKPTDRSISPQTSRNTSPIAMMAIGAAP